MPTPGRGQAIRERFNRLVEDTWKLYGPDDKVTSQYNLYRRQTTTSTTDLGVPKTPWTAVATDEPCMYIGAWSTSAASAERFGLMLGGKRSQTMLVIWTTRTDVQVGDDLFLAEHQRHYHVQEVHQEGGLHRLLVDSGQAQNQSP